MKISLLAQLLPEKGVPNDLLSPSRDSLSGVVGSASAQAVHNGTQGRLGKGGNSNDDDEPGH
jgi:hypothetical protein